MNEGLIPRRYAKALYATALEHKADASVYSRMLGLEAAFASTPGLQEVMSNPFVDDKDKMALLSTACGLTSGDTILADFFKLLANNKRLDMARRAALAYIDIYRQRHGIYKVEVRSAAPLSADDESRLKKLISNHLNGGTMEYSSAVDPSLIGGFTVSVGNERLDASISNELKQLRLNLLSK